MLYGPNGKAMAPPGEHAQIELRRGGIRGAARLCYSLSMSARILDGLKIRDEIFAELKDEIAGLTAQGVRPGLAAVLVGENPASQLYVKSKIAACEQLGMASWLHTPPASITTAEMLELVAKLNADDSVDGIL